MNKYLILSLVVNIILLIVLGYGLLKVGVLQVQNQMTNLTTQTLQNTQTLQQVVGWINGVVQQSQIKK